MPLFQVCDLTLESSEPFPELLLSSPARADIAFCMSPRPRTEFSGCEWLPQRDLADGTPWLASARVGGGYLLRFPEYADFLVAAGGGDITCFAEGGVPAETIRHLFLDQVIPLLLSQRGRLVLHASAVAAPEGAIAFLGSAGAGKSTLAASLARRGLPLLTDDCFLLREQNGPGGKFLAVPSYPGIRLWDDTLAGLEWNATELAAVSHYSDKKRVAAGNGNPLPAVSEPLPVARLYVLAPPESRDETDAVRITPLPPREALLALVRYTYCLDVADRDCIRSQFESLARLAAGTPVRHLTFPYDFSRLPALQDAILRDVIPRDTILREPA